VTLYRAGFLGELGEEVALEVKEFRVAPVGSGVGVVRPCQVQLENKSNTQTNTQDSDNGI